MSTCNRLDLETLGSGLVMLKFSLNTAFKTFLLAPKPGVPMPFYLFHCGHSSLAYERPVCRTKFLEIPTMYLNSNKITYFLYSEKVWVPTCRNRSCLPVEMDSLCWLAKSI